MSDNFNCPHCEDTGRITVRNTYPMTYVCAGDPPDDAKGLVGMRCTNCDPVALAAQYNDDDED